MRIFNPGPGPVVISQDGRVLGGGEAAELSPADTNSPVLRAHLDAARVIKADAPAPAKSASKESEQ